MASWTYQGWSQDDNINSGIPYVSSGSYPTTPDFTNVASVWTLEYGLPTPSVPYIDVIDLDDTRLIFDIHPTNNFGLPYCGLHYVKAQGSHMGCTNLTSVTIPASVTVIEPYAFFESSLSSATLSPDCLYYQTTFPVGCTLSYYPTVIRSVSFDDSTELNVSVGQSMASVYAATTVMIRISVGGSYIERECKKFTIEGVDTSAAVTGATGTIKIETKDGTVSITQTFTYNVT